MKAEWRVKGIYKADAQKVADEIGNDKITPQEMIEKARNEKSELHKCFEWNDTIAAEKYRLQQARNVLAMLVFKPKTEEEQQVRIFSLTTEKSVYQPTKQFLVQSDEYQDLLKRALAELETFKRKYSTLNELEEVFKAIEEF
ncbi:MAG: hypothetical protein HFH72_09115 [Lachnospiraceae bacterium]|nr:hypothetical protein [Lachnospiraceae bacterium]